MLFVAVVSLCERRASASKRREEKRKGHHLERQVYRSFLLQWVAGLIIFFVPPDWNYCVPGSEKMKNTWCIHSSILFFVFFSSTFFTQKRFLACDDARARELYLPIREKVAVTSCEMCAHLIFWQSSFLLATGVKQKKRV